MKTANHNAICGTCGKHHTVDKSTLQAFGFNAQCMGCVNTDHIIFMNKTGRRLGLSCVKGCPCAAKVKK